MTKPSDNRIREVLLDLAHQRGADKSFCPSEAARALSPNWRDLMHDIRRVAAGMDALEATQGGRPVDAVQAKGPIRLRRTE